MSFLSALNADAWAKAFAPQIKDILATEGSDEDKALKVAETIADNFLSAIVQEFHAVNQTLLSVNGTLSAIRDLVSNGVQITPIKPKEQS